MGQGEMARWLKVVDALALACCILFFGGIVPQALGQAAAESGSASLLMPCLVVAWASVIPMAAISVLAWKIFSDIGCDKSFTQANAQRLKTISYLACSVLVIYLAGLTILAAVGFLPTVVIVVLSVVLIGSLIIAVVGAALSHLTAKAAAIQSENDLTV